MDGHKVRDFLSGELKRVGQCHKHPLLPRPFSCENLRERHRYAKLGLPPKDPRSSKWRWPLGCVSGEVVDDAHSSGLLGARPIKDARLCVMLVQCFDLSSQRMRPRVAARVPLWHELQELLREFLAPNKEKLLGLRPNRQQSVYRRYPV